ncbi:D-threonine aldolase [Arenibacter antarcticus]|uniref:D-TA family PLP-dependent enzyme n=1 Tax=Arenibacter antarcticus TaxID=2040469 RepID=A0ABW5VIS1_9FLAO|nr:D-TA family PLP-dependent enzyme [Arenibacter sp. H213]MCM4166863.1 threonine aldolase [Arenibacter sp. H213]
MTAHNWYTITDTKDIITPSLVVYPDRIEKNIRTMIKMAGGVQRLRPHIKTHKMAQIVHLQIKHGIEKFKCATLAEAELLGKCGAKDILMAMQPVAANIERFFTLVQTFPDSNFSTLTDNLETAGEIAKIAAEKFQKASLWLDINNGMDRTGICPDKTAQELYKYIHHHPNLIASGLHVYDGHIRIQDPAERKKACDRDFASVLLLKDDLENAGIPVPTIVAGGSPTFPFHAIRQGVETSPGTTLLWDAGYGDSFKDLEFLHAAVLLTRVISKPNTGKVCFDLGHKWLASEMNFPRVQFLGVENWEQIGQSEEHFIVQYPQESELKVGHLAYAIPKHICPTVAKYDWVLTAVDGIITDSWKVAARDKKITI